MRKTGSDLGERESGWSTLCYVLSPLPPKRPSFNPAQPCQRCSVYNCVQVCEAGDRPWSRGDSSVWSGQRSNRGGRLASPPCVFPRWTISGGWYPAAFGLGVRPQDLTHLLSCMAVVCPHSASLTLRPKFETSTFNARAQQGPG
jgi:hypothetical protein